MSSPSLPVASARRGASRALEVVSGVVRFVETIVPSVLLAGMVALVSADVIRRYVFNSPITGTSEWTAVAVVWIVLIGMARAAGVRAHVAISILSDRLPDRQRHWFERSIDVVTAAICAVAAYASWHLVDATRKRSLPLTDFPVFWVNIAAPIGFLLAALHYLAPPEDDGSEAATPIAEVLE